jgi:hypothetical protein
MDIDGLTCSSWSRTKLREGRGQHVLPFELDGDAEIVSCEGVMTAMINVSSVTPMRRVDLLVRK